MSSGDGMILLKITLHQFLHGFFHDRAAFGFFISLQSTFNHLVEILLRSLDRAVDPLTASLNLSRHS